MRIEAVAEIFLAYKEGYPGFLLADDVGLGKTFAAWASILKILESSEEKRKILIVRTRWKRKTPLQTCLGRV
jgi:SNF2 family DNA or RNA helicase